MNSTGVLSVQILENHSLSSGVDLGGYKVVAFEMPESWTGTTITFQGKAKRGQDVPVGEGYLPEDWDDIYDDNGTELSATVAANRIVGLRGDQAVTLAAIRYLRIRSGTAASPVIQAAAREIRLILKS